MTFSAAFLFSMSVVAAQVGAEPMDEPMTESERIEYERVETERVEDEGFAEETGEAIDETVEETGEELGEAADAAQREFRQMDAPEVEVEREPVIEREPTAVRTDDDMDINVDFGGTDPQREETLLGMEPVGAMLMVGGGAVNFATSGPEQFTETGGYWNARLAGTRTILSGEVAYLGRAQGINATGLSAGSTLLGNGVEGLARLNAPFEAGEVLIEPFAVAGASWEYFTILNEGANTSSLDDNDAVVFLPVGVGLAGAWQGLSLDVRGLYRHAFLSEMFGDSGFGLNENALNTWQLGANLGFEF